MNYGFYEIGFFIFTGVPRRRRGPRGTRNDYRNDSGTEIRKNISGLYSSAARIARCTKRYLGNSLENNSIYFAINTSYKRPYGRHCHILKLKNH